MPRYHFALVDSTTVSDKGGQILVDDERARGAAIQLAADIREARPELVGKGYRVVVTDPRGQEIHEAPLDEQ